MEPLYAITLPDGTKRVGTRAVLDEIARASRRPDPWTEAFSDLASFAQAVLAEPRPS